MPYRRSYKKSGRKRGSGPKRKSGIYSKRRKVRSADTVRRIARKAATNVLKDKRPLLHRRFNLDANSNGYENLVHNQWQFYFCNAHAVGFPYTGGLCELAGQGATGWPLAPQYGGLTDNNTTRRIPLCEEPGAAPGLLRTHKWIEGARVHGQITFTQPNSRCGGKVRIMIVKYKQGGFAMNRDDVIMQTNCASTGTLPAQNLFDAPQRPKQYRAKSMTIIKDFVVSLKNSGGAMYGAMSGLNGVPPPALVSQTNGDTIVKFSVPLNKKFFYDEIDQQTYDPNTATPSKWNVGFAVCAYGGNQVPATTNIAVMTFKGDLTFRNPI